MSGMQSDPAALRLRSLQASIREDWTGVQANVESIRRIVAEGTSEEVRAAATATHLVRMYTGIEEIFQRIAEQFNGGAPQGFSWHRDLLALMARDVPKARPPIISKELHDRLDEYRKFRHRVMHAYGVILEWEKMRTLVEGAPLVCEETQTALTAFHQFVDGLCEAL